MIEPSVVNVEVGVNEILVLDLCCVCQKESDVACHGIRDGQVYDEFYCESDYNTKKRTS